jgi:plastocyanin
MRPWGIALLAAAALAACGGSGDRGGAPARTPTPLDHTSTGTIAGVVRFDGTPPPMGTLPLAGWAGCADEYHGAVPTGDVLVHDGLVENAFVYIKEGLGTRVFAVPTAPVVIDQRGCVYRPRVVGAQVGQPIEFVNDDPTLHNVHGTPHDSSPWNFTMPVQGSRRTVRLEKPEVMVSVRCDLHPWMQGWIGVVDHPYFAVTGADGRFKLDDVPPGDYVVAAWHERFGVREMHVSLPPKGTAEATFTFVPSG